MTQQGIYISPDNIVPNRDRGNKQNLYLYVCKYNIAYGNGMVLVAARNPMRAMEILEATNRKDDYGYSVYQDADLEHVVPIMAMRASCINNIILNNYGNRKANKVESQR